MHDVARVAGVSHVTVSRVLNDYPSIRPDTRARVVDAIAQLGYRRNLAARALVTSRSHAIGVLTPAVAQHGPSSSVLAIESAARELGYHPLVTAAAVDHDATIASLEFLLDQSVEALVVIAPHQLVLDAIHELRHRDPARRRCRRRGEAADLVVGVDQLAGGALATRHLIELGHRVIQHVSGPATYFEATLADAAISTRSPKPGSRRLPILEGDWSAASGHRPAARARPDGDRRVLCERSDRARADRRARRAGRRVPATSASSASMTSLRRPSSRRRSRPCIRTSTSSGVGSSRCSPHASGVRRFEHPLLEPWLVLRESTRSIR